MIGGQVVDVESEKKNETVERDGYHGPRFIWVAER